MIPEFHSVLAFLSFLFLHMRALVSGVLDRKSMVSCLVRGDLEVSRLRAWKPGSSIALLFFLWCTFRYEARMTT